MTHHTIDWKRKLTSRKFWLSVASFTAMLLVALGKSQEVATQVTSLIMAGATVIGYAIGEGLADGHGERSDHGHSTGHAESAGYAESTDYAESTGHGQSVDCT
jgi:hypothetical protein